MNESLSEREPSAPLASPEPVFPPQAFHVAMPSLVPKVTYALLGFTVLIYLLQLASVAVFGYAVNRIDWLEVYGARFNQAIRMGEVWRFITPVFLHSSVLHILFNMYALFSIGSFLERYFERKRFVLLYFLSAFAGNVFSFLLNEGYSIGASTAVFGLVAAQLVFFYQNRILFGSQAKRAIGNAVFIIVLNLLIGLIPMIDAWGNIGGLFGGAMFAWFASPRWKLAGISPDFHLEDQREFREIVLGAGMVIVIFGGLAVWGML